jgi:hypothetical protein
LTGLPISAGQSIGPAPAGRKPALVRVSSANSPSTSIGGVSRPEEEDHNRSMEIVMPDHPTYWSQVLDHLIRRRVESFAIWWGFTCFVRQANSRSFSISLRNISPCCTSLGSLICGFMPSNIRKHHEGSAECPLQPLGSSGPMIGKECHFFWPEWNFLMDQPVIVNGRVRIVPI